MYTFTFQSHGQHLSYTFGYVSILFNKKIKDFRAYALAEIGTIFMALVLITGPIWANPHGVIIGLGNQG